MVKRSQLEHVPGNPGDNVTIPIPFVDRGKGDPRNIIVDRDEKDLYRVAVRAGILKGRYSRNHMICAPSCIALSTCLDTVMLAYVRQCRVSPGVVVRAIPNATV